MAPQKTCIIGRWVASLLTTLYYQDNILIINKITVQILYCIVHNIYIFVRCVLL